jgi:hypothetical protein
MNPIRHTVRTEIHMGNRFFVAEIDATYWQGKLTGRTKWLLRSKVRQLQYLKILTKEARQNISTTLASYCA